MRLSQWLSDRKMTDAQFAELVGKDQTTINRTRRGVTMPNPGFVARIVEATAGEVQPADLYAAYSAAQPSRVPRQCPEVSA
ncbi:helix-turn-helix domain-containing protein [Rhodovarius crocodyli]|uniref:helix-turn-helix domain-containing protein n=1 Tax=Rhodovarius crocodyli TaxID=1979269 RepID=UPI0030B82ECE